MPLGNLPKAAGDTELEQFQLGLKIDRNALDDACETHAELYHRVQEAYVMAESIRDERKAFLDQTEAEMDMQTRRAYEKEGREKWTETQIKHEVKTSKEYLDALASLQDAQLRMKRLSILVSSYETRSKMLQKLGDLYQSGYFVLNALKGTKSAVAGVDAEAGRAAMAGVRRARVGRS